MDILSNSFNKKYEIAKDLLEKIVTPPVKVFLIIKFNKYEVIQKRTLV